MATHISLTFEGACEKAIVDALRGEHTLYEADIMAEFRIDTAPNGRILCACGETSSLIAEALINNEWHTGHAGYCDCCGSDDYDGSSIAVSGAGRFRTVQPAI